jgi:hypothetical protein
MSGKILSMFFPQAARLRQTTLSYEFGEEIMNLVRRAVLYSALAVVVGLPWIPVFAQEPTVTPEAAHAIGVNAYLYFYPLVTMDLTRKQSTNIEPGKEIGKGPMNMFVNVPEYPPATMKTVVRTNYDTLYSVAWLDTTKEPVIVSAPDTGERYYMLPMLDMWTDVFACPGSRTTGTQAGNFLIASSSWQGTVPQGVTRINAPTPYVWIIGRTKTDGPSDYDAVHKIQAGYKITPLSQWGNVPDSVSVKIDPSVDSIGAGGSSKANGVEIPHACPGCKRMVDEHRHDRCLW